MANSRRVHTDLEPCCISVHGMKSFAHSPSHLITPRCAVVCAFACCTHHIATSHIASPQLRRHSHSLPPHVSFDFMTKPRFFRHHVNSLHLLHLFSHRFQNAAKDSGQTGGGAKEDKPTTKIYDKHGGILGGSVGESAKSASAGPTKESQKATTSAQAETAAGQRAVVWSPYPTLTSRRDTCTPCCATRTPRHATHATLHRAKPQLARSHARSIELLREFGAAGST
jgi:hypothetical protein